jgi:hypothetical protein
MCLSHFKALTVCLIIVSPPMMTILIMLVCQDIYLFLVIFNAILFSNNFLRSKEQMVFQT